METNILKKAFGRTLRAKRTAKGLSQERLADLTSLTRTSITNIEGGHQLVSLSALYELAEALDTEAANLLPTRQRIKEQLESMKAVAEASPEKVSADIADWVDTVTAKKD